jgi:uncharacterized protein (TIGR02246 family)
MIPSTRKRMFLPLCMIVTIAFQNVFATELSPEAVVRAYTDAANRHDLEAFLALYAPDIRKFRFPGELASSGIEHNRQVYTKSFAQKSKIKVEIVELITLNDKVIVHDRVTGRPDGKTADEVTIYQVENGKITNIVYVEQQLH